MKRLAWFNGVILATFTVSLLFWEFRAVVVLFIASLTIAASLRSVVDWFAARGLPRGLRMSRSLLQPPRHPQHLREQTQPKTDEARTQTPVQCPNLQATFQQ